MMYARVGAVSQYRCSQEVLHEILSTRADKRAETYLVPLFSPRHLGTDACFVQQEPFQAELFWLSIGTAVDSVTGFAIRQCAAWASTATIRKRFRSDEERQERNQETKKKKKQSSTLYP